MARVLLGKVSGGVQDLTALARAFGRLHYSIGPINRRVSLSNAKSLEMIVVSRIKAGVDAFGNTMPPLTQATLNSLVLDDSGNQIGKRSSFGNTPMVVTGETVKAIQGRRERDGFSIRINTKRARDIVAWHCTDKVISVSNKMRHKLRNVVGIYLSIGKGSIERPARPLIGLSPDDLRRMSQGYLTEILDVLRRAK